MAHELPPLPYDHAALEPHIDAQTMQIHHGKHHQTYVTNLNNALQNHPDLQGKSVEDLCRGINSVPDAIRTAVRNNGGGHWRSEEHTSELQSQSNLVCRLLLEKKNNENYHTSR